MITHCPDEQIARVLEYLELRFGLDRSLFAGFGFYAGAKGRVILGPRDLPASLNADTAGLLIARVHRSVKPTTNLFQVFGKHVTRNRILLSPEQAIRFLQGLDLVICEQDQVLATPGYVLIQYDDYSLGCGAFRDNNVKNMLPRAKRLEVKFF